MAEADLFWSPEVGDLVELKPGTLRHEGALKCELTHPLLVKKVFQLDGHPMVWYEPTGPVREVKQPNGRVRIERPSYQAPAMVENLQPHTPRE